jgi:imidazolonepropionase-like amidohydrolase
MRTLLTFITAALLLAGGATEALAQDLVITNARVIVGNGTVLEKGAVVVKGGRIASVGPTASNAPAGARTIDAKGMTVMPGFIDGHRHIIGGNTDQWFKEQAAVRMQEFLEAGYTTLMSGGGPVPGIVQLKERIEKGQIKGPRIITSGRADPPGFKTEQEARAAVQQLAKAGVEIIKARVDNDPSPQQMAILAAVVDEGKKFKLDTMVHAVSPKAMLATVKAGAQKLVHTPHFGWLTEADAKVVRDAGVEVLSCAGFGVPVFGVYNQANQPTFRDGNPWPEAILDGEGRGREAGYKAVNARTLWDGGVVYGFGTDTNYHPLEGLEHELRTLNLMFSPQDLIKLLGPNTAAFLDRSQDLGTLERYWNLLRTKLVVKGGDVVVDKR